MTYILSSVLIMLFIIALAVILFKKLYVDKQIEKIQKESDEILKNSIRDAENEKSKIILDAREESHKLREKVENEIYERHKDIQEQEKKIKEKEYVLNEKINDIAQKELALKNESDKLQNRLQEISTIKGEQIKTLEVISNYTSEQAKNELFSLFESSLLDEKIYAILNFKRSLNEMKKEIAQEILSSVIQRYSSDYVSESTVSIVNLPYDSLKGCIIGREGRNIRAIEALTGVDLIIDDSPDIIALSSFDPYRRAIAKLAIELLIADGRIQPARIEEMVEKAKNDIDNNIKSEGQRTIMELKVNQIHSELVYLIGNLKYRTSYGQNALQHSIEVAYLSSMLASELGLDPVLAKRCGLLHDIGKSLTYQREGSHIEVGVDVLKKCCESEEVINVVESHHGACEPKSPIAVIVQAADAISASRPGARKENLENYIERLKNLESLVNSFDSVDKCYAIQAGREIRVMVSPDKVDDNEMIILARDICKKIEKELSYPCQVKISLIRESRVVEYARY